MYITKEMYMVNNIDSIYVKIWGQCIDSLQNIIYHLEIITVKHKDKDVIWLHKNLKIVFTGI